MKKIVISSNTSWNIYNFRLNLIREIKKRGYKVIVVSPYDKYSDLLKKEFDYYDVFLNNKSINPLDDLKTIINYFNIYKEIKPDLALHFTVKPNIYGNMACKLLHIKTINNISGLGSAFIRDNFITKIVKTLYKFSLKNSSKIFFQNEDDLNLFVNLNIIKKNKADIIPGSGVDIEKFKPVNCKKKNDIFTFLMVSRVVKDKGVLEYLEACKLLKEKGYKIECQLIGSFYLDNPTAISKEYIKKYEEKDIITYLGVTDNIKDIIAKADCIVLPSYREGTSRVLLESASMAKPIITTNVPGCKEVVDDGLNGFLCEVKNAKDLADKMEKMLNLSEEERNAMGQKGREKIIKEFDEKIVISKYLNTIEELV